MSTRLRIPPALVLAPALLGIARLLPAYGFGLWLRLAAATLVLLLPGRFVARALGMRGVAPALAWSTALVGGALAIAVFLHTSLDLVLALVLLAGVGALAWCLLRRPPLRAGGRRGHVTRVRGLVLLAGLALGGAVWFVEGVVYGDELFHLGRIRKLLDLSALSLHRVGEFKHGSLHPGYAFPLWHAWLALVARIGGVDPTAVVVHESSLLVPLALLLAFEMGLAVFRSRSLAYAAMLAQVSLLALAPGGGGAYAQLTGPGTAARQLFVPAAVALFFRFVREPVWQVAVALAAVSADLSFVHPTYALFLAVPLAAFVAARALLARGADLRAGLGALAAFVAPMALVFAWLRPIVNQTLSVSPGPNELARSLRHYGGDLVVHSAARYAVDPAIVARTGSVAIAALVLTPVAVLARGRRWSALVLGGGASVLALTLWPFVFPHFADAVSLSQARRAAGFVPFAFAFAGGLAVLARLSRLGALAAALGAGIWLQLAYPGDFGLRTPHNGPAAAGWIALYGALAALALGTLLAWTRRPPEPRRAPGPLVALAATLFVLPVAVHGFANWRASKTRDPYALTPGLVRFLQEEVPARAVVFGDLETSYRVVAFAPVYVVGAPPAHVANTKRNRLYQRRRAVLRFFAHPDDLAVPRRWGAHWLVLRRHEPVAAVERSGLRPVYEDDRYVVFRL